MSLKGYIVKLTTTEYGPVSSRQEACKLAMQHATYTRKPKIYSLSGEYIGEVYKTETQIKRKGLKGFHFLFKSADGVIGNIVSTTGVVIKQNSPYKEEYKGGDYLIYNSSRPHKMVGKANTIDKARKLAIELSKSTDMDTFDFFKWVDGREYIRCGYLWIRYLSTGSQSWLECVYRIESKSDNAYRTWGLFNWVLIDPVTGVVIGKRK